ncbi:MAG: PD-(D/E)XK nuclease family protein [Rickettsiaceae bacterium]|nr:PD-(D/E)XK nuclease family protein [Rickettsiaceae bacterium]MDP5020155.1 PD-(D/E)XK nuclease family protein [Rickettsiaceae bacterium]MDP5082747.1 PD-(D/E)XK nuclease family protein [Rickettsiaceae bacterium]
MQIYQASSKENFLQEIVSFTHKHFANEFSNLKIILPSGLLCSQLQNTFIENFQTSILPTIIPLGGLVAESNEVFKIPSEQIGCLSKLEEKITLATTIYSYKKLGYDLSQSLRLAPSLANLFFEFEANNINLHALQDLPTLDQPEHWYTIYDFLCYASENWRNQITNVHKMTRAAYQKLVFKAEIMRLKNNKAEHLLLAGITGSNLMSNEFIKNAAKLPNVSIILSPFINVLPKEAPSPENALYRIYQLIELLKPQQPIIKLGIESPQLIDKLIASSSSNRLESTIKYIEFENIFHEAEYIALQCLNKKKENIAIIVHSGQAKEQYCTFLDKYNLDYHDIFGLDILKQPVISFLLLLSEYLCSDFDTKNFFTVISHPLINSPTAQSLKNLIRQKNRLASNLDTISTIVQEHASDEVKEYYQGIYIAVSKKLTSKKFAIILKHSIKMIETLIPDIWQTCPAISASLTEINQANWQLELNTQLEFPEVLKQLLEGGRITETKPNSNITICRAHESTLINYDLIIISDLNEGVYPMSVMNSPWLNTQMQKELKLDSSLANLGSTLYDFYLNMNNKNILLTRAKKQASKQLLPSPFILHLRHILEEKLNTYLAKPLAKLAPPLAENFYAQSKIFPSKISATDIEMLIRSPYNFYAKKLLALKKAEEIDEKPNLAEFGNFFHLVVEQYTKNYSHHTPDKESVFLEIANCLLETHDIPNYSKKSWLTKITAIAPEFIQFDNDKRKSSINVYSEIKGELTLDIAGQKVTLIAVADRIDIDQNNTVKIIDYKTGVVPSKKDVLSGLSPQLLIEAIILSEGGFTITPPKIFSLIYVKINSSKPYINTTEIIITQDDLSIHKQGLISLIKHYIENMNFVVEPNLMKYDNYSHLARRL